MGVGYWPLSTLFLLINRLCRWRAVRSVPNDCIALFRHAPAESMVVLGPSVQPVPAQPQAQVFDSWDAFTRSSVQPLGFYLER